VYCSSVPGEEGEQSTTISAVHPNIEDGKRDPPRCERVSTPEHTIKRGDTPRGPRAVISPSLRDVRSGGGKRKGGRPPGFFSSPDSSTRRSLIERRARRKGGAKVLKSQSRHDRRKPKGGADQGSFCYFRGGKGSLFSLAMRGCSSSPKGRKINFDLLLAEKPKKPVAGVAAMVYQVAHKRGKERGNSPPSWERRRSSLVLPCGAGRQGSPPVGGLRQKGEEGRLFAVDLCGGAKKKQLFSPTPGESRGEQKSVISATAGKKGRRFYQELGPGPLL